MITQLDTPYAKNSDTSKEAADSVREHLGHLEAKVLTCIRTAADAGMTREEIEESTQLLGNCVRPRVWSLMKRGLVVDSGRRRPTLSGRKAAVLIAA